MVEKNAYSLATKNYLIAGSISINAFSMNHWEVEPNNTTALSSYYALDGVEFGGQLSSVADIDVYKFNVSTPGLLTFTARFENSNYNGTSLHISIKDASANVLAGTDLHSDSAPITLNAGSATKK